MHDMHRILDGERPREPLSADEVRELAAHQAAIAGALDTLPRTVPAGLEAEVMARVRAAAAASAAGLAPATAPAASMAGASAAGASAAGSAAAAGGRGPSWRRPGAALTGALEWLWAPRAISLTLRPAYALGVLALAAVALLGPGRPWAPAPRAEVATRVFVHFRLDAPGAHAVSLAGDFTNWQPRYELHEAAPGVWSIAVPLAPGVHDYAFVVDGRSWRPDPLAPAVADGFGGTNSRVAVLPPVTGRDS